jgi:hypothetical protein
MSLGLVFPTSITLSGNGAARACVGTGDGILPLSGEASIASFGGIATTAATAAEAASVVPIAKFGFDALTVLYGGIVACSQ